MFLGLVGASCRMVHDRTSSDFSCGGKALGNDFRMNIQEYKLLD